MVCNIHPESKSNYLKAYRVFHILKNLRIPRTFSIEYRVGVQRVPSVSCGPRDPSSGTVPCWESTVCVVCNSPIIITSESYSHNITSHYNTPSLSPFPLLPFSPSLLSGWRDCVCVDPLLCVPSCGNCSPGNRSEVFYYLSCK